MSIFHLINVIEAGEKKLAETFNRVTFIYKYVIIPDPIKLRNSLFLVGKNCRFLENISNAEE